MAYILSPSMNLPIPGVGTEASPQWSLDLNSSLSLIDQHDHSPGKGVLITPAGLNINAALNFNSNPATNVSYLSLIAASSASSVVQSVSSAPAAGINELWYTDSNGTSTQITSNGVVNAIAAAIPGESYNAGTFIWTQTQSSLPTTPANFDIGSITIRPNTAGTTNGVTLGPPSGIASAYDINLPLLPGSNSVLLLSSAGIMSTASGTSSQYLAGGSTPSFQSFKAPTQQVLSSGSGTYNTPSGAIAIKIRMIGGGGGGGGAANTGAGNGGTGGNSTFSSYTAAGGGGGTAGSSVSGSGLGGAPNANSGSPSISIQGSYGLSSVYVNAGSPAGNGGSGGSGVFGGSGQGGRFDAVGMSEGIGKAAAVNSGGGGGGASPTSGANFGAGGGASGSYVEQLISSPVSTYSYSVGAAGSAGSAGTGYTGAAGGSGIIIIDEFYQ